AQLFQRRWHVHVCSCGVCVACPDLAVMVGGWRASVKMLVALPKLSVLTGDPAAGSRLPAVVVKRTSCPDRGTPMLLLTVATTVTGSTWTPPERIIEAGLAVMAIVAPSGAVTSDF